MEMNLTSSEKRWALARYLLVSLLFCTLIIPALAQDRVTVTGRLTDATGGLVGASVVESGTTNGVTTDAEGRYQITVKGTATLDFSYIGYQTQTLAVMNRSQIDVKMAEDATMIGEVVAIGYGSQRKEDLSMAVSTIKVDDAVRSRAGDLGVVLQGRMPGVTVLQSGDPMKKASFSIRGRGSKGNDDGEDRGNDGMTSGDGVLVVVDGVPGAPYMVEDIETITILKDAASAAIYGASVGSSGVVLITTRKAQAGVTRVDVNVSFGVEKVGKLPSMLNAAQFCDVWGKAVGNSENGSLPMLANPELYAGANITRTNWLDEAYRTGLKQHYAVSLSGGNETLQSIFSVTYDKKEGTLINTWSQALGAKLYTEYKPTKWLKISERVSFDYSNGQGNVSTSHTGPILGAMWFPASASIYDLDADGKVILDDDGKPKWGGIASTIDMGKGVEGPNIVNPIAQLQKMRRSYPRTKVFSTTSMEIKPISSLTFKSDFTADMDLREEDEFSPVIKVPGGSTIASREQFNFNRTHFLWESTITWAQVFGKHHISAMGGFTTDYKKNIFRKFSTQAYNGEEDHDLTWAASNVAWTKNPEEKINDYALMSLFARVGYSFDDRYFVVGSIRRDASSKLPSHNNSDIFPSVSASWKLSSEKFFSNSVFGEVFDLVKFRGGWGRVGNVDLYSLSSSMSIPLLTHNDPVWIGGSDRYGSYLSTIPNLNARWETTEQYSAGLDLALFKNKLDISVDWYHKTTIDLVDVLPTGEQIGIPTPPMGNMGEVLNKGWEFSASYKDSAAGGKLNYNVWANFSINDGKVLSYGSQIIKHGNPNINSQYILTSGAGSPWYSYNVYRTAGIFRSQRDIEQHITKDTNTGEVKPLQPNAKLGDLIYVDTNGDGVINDDDRVMSGSYNPKQTFSLGGSLEWKGFDFSFMLQGVAGNYIYNGTKQMAMNGRNDLGNLIKDVYNTWDFNPENSKYPRLGLSEDQNGNYTRFSDAFLEKGDYLRLKNITLGYTLPKHVSRYVGLARGSVRVYMSIDNLATITGYTGVDPEVGNYGVDSGVYPISRFYNFGVNINF